jgi:hypothetical protein
MFKTIGAPEIAIMGGAITALGLILLPYIFYLISLKTVVERCSRECRALSPGQVWLLLIPIFNLGWHFVVVDRIATTIATELRSRGRQTEMQPGKGIGLAMCILTASTIIPVLGVLTAIAAVICWILYWVKICDYARILDLQDLRIPTTLQRGAAA